MSSGLPVNRWGADELARAMGEALMVIDSRREEHVTSTGATQSFVWLFSERC